MHNLQAHCEIWFSLLQHMIVNRSVTLQGRHKGRWQGVHGRYPRFLGIQQGCFGVQGRNDTGHVLLSHTPNGPRLLKGPNGRQGPKGRPP